MLFIRMDWRVAEGGNLPAYFSYPRALQILETNSNLLEEGAKQLLEKETLLEQDLAALFRSIR